MLLRPGPLLFLIVGSCLGLAHTACGGGQVAPGSGGDDAAAVPDGSGADGGTPSHDAGVNVGQDGGLITVRTGVMEVAVDQDNGTVGVKDTIWGTEVRKLHFAVEVVNGQATRVFTTVGKPLACTSNLGGAAATLACKGEVGSGFTVAFTAAIDSSRPGVLSLEPVFTNAGTVPVKVRKVYPFRAAASAGGAFFIGKDPAKVRILQNGTDEVVDFYVNVLIGDTVLSAADQNALIGGHSSFSSGSALAFDTGSGAPFLAGFTDFDWAIPLVAMAGDVSKAVPAGGRTPMTEMWGEARFPWDVEIPAGKAVSGGAAVIVVGEKTPFDALERYADEVAARHAITLPPAPTSGWDSWYTGIAAGLTEDYVRQNADALGQKFVPYGLSGMQLDEGWNDTWGDWNANASFPSGIPATVDHIKQRGLTPEVWMAPLSAAETAKVYTDHHDWFTPKNPYGDVLMAKDMHPFDLGNPGVLDYVRALGARLKDWGFGSVKMDFAYYTLLSAFPPDPDRTNTALYRNAVKEFRTAVGANTYFINIAMCFPNYGLVDGFRIGLDTWPCWNGGSDCPDHNAGGISAQGVKPAVTMAARRYWMNGRIWWNHHDQVFMRDLTEEEQRAWVAIAGLSGGMISLGENAVNLSSRQADLYRHILPLTGLTARPVDLFEREVPEVWHVPTADPAEGDVIGLFNWGSNRDLTTNPYTPRDDGAPVTHAVDLKSLGMDPDAEYIAYEFWTGETTDGIKGTFNVEVAPHTSRVFRLAKKTGGVFFLATDRHILMGPGLIRGSSWNPSTSKFTGQIKSTTEYYQTFFLWHPAEFNDTFTQIDGVKDPQSGGKPENTANLYYLTFTGQDADWHTFEVTFRKK